MTDLLTPEIKKTEKAQDDHSIKYWLTKALKDAKWWIPTLSVITSTILLSRYLWAIGHPELLLGSLDNPTNLLTWLLFSTLGFTCLLLVLSMPSIVLSLAIHMSGTQANDKGKLAIYWVFLVLICFAVMAICILYVPAQFYSAWWVILAQCILGCIGVFALSSRPTASGSEFTSSTTRYNSSENAGRLQHRLILGVAGALVGFSGACGIFPAQIVLAAWHGEENGNFAKFILFGYFLFLLIAALVPLIVYLNQQASLAIKIRNTIGAILGSAFVVFMTLPAVADLGVFAGANLLKLRDGQARYYLLASADYPRSLFSSAVWKLETLSDDKALYVIDAFKQFSFGSVALLCPGRFSSTPLRKVSSFSQQCVSVSNSKIRFATQARPNSGRSAKIENTTCLISAPVQAIIPQPIIKARSCVIAAPSNSAPLLH